MNKKAIEITKLRREANDIEKEARILIQKVFDTFHKPITNAPKERWYINEIVYCEDHIVVEMYWDERWGYGGHDSGYYNFEFPYEYWDDPTLIDKEIQRIAEVEIAKLEEKKIADAHKAEKK